MTIVPDFAEMAERFNRQIIGLPIPLEPQSLSAARKKWALTALREELQEFEDTNNLDDEADALIDLTYFALGRLIEMGIAPRPIFEEVHAANMKKRRGELSKRPNSLGYDAVKPDGWQPPDLEPYLVVNQKMLRMAYGEELIRQDDGDDDDEDETVVPVDFRSERPKILVIGHARHGKDTVCELLQEYGLKFTSSSFFCAERVLMPLMAKEQGYKSAGECFSDRHNHRSIWYDALRDFNRPDATALARAILDENDVYCGMRSKAEFHACKNAGLFDAIIWVDGSDRLPPEDKSSCTVEPWMADYVIDNNGDLADLQFNLSTLMDALFYQGEDRDDDEQ